MFQDFLHKSNKTKYPYIPINSDDGSGNLVSYDPDNPLSGWTPVDQSPHDGLWVRVIFSDAAVNYNYDGSTWVVHSVESSGGIVLFSSSEVLTGFVTENSEPVYCKTFNITGADSVSVPGIGRIYETDILKAGVDRIVGINAMGTDESSPTWIYAAELTNLSVAKHSGYDNLIVYALSNLASVKYDITIYYTKN